MDRNRIVVLLVALVCVGGLAIAAATVSTPNGGSSGSGPGSGGGDGSGTQGSPPPRDSSSVDISDEYIVLGALVFTVTALIAIVIVARALNLRRFVIFALSFLVVSIAGLLLVWLFLDAVSFGGGGQPPAQPTPTDGGGGSGANGRVPTESPSQRTDLPIALLGVFGMVALLLVTVIYRYSSTDTDVAIDPESGTTDEETDQAGVQAVGQAAGRAADRLDADSENVENTVYQAWREMTDALDVREPKTTTPEEFAEIAIDAGMAPDDVRELTWLFEEVRYGEVTVTEDRERRAREALRRIQAAYAGGDGRE